MRILFPRFFTRRRTSHRSGDHFRERHKALKSLCAFPHISFRTVCKLLHPVGYADGDLAAAHRADPIIFHSVRRRQAEIALPVPIHMVFPFLREKLDGTVQSLSCLYRLHKPFVGHRDIQQICLSPQLRRRMSIRIRHELEPVQGGNSPVHRRIRRKPCLHGMDMRGQILKALFRRIKPGKRAEHGKMRRPDMRRHIHR